jgi:hypothetical protein
MNFREHRVLIAHPVEHRIGKNRVERLVRIGQRLRGGFIGEASTPVTFAPVAAMRVLS